MHGDTLHTIGDLARLTGLTVKTIRFYSDRGIVPPTGRNPAGHRLYGPDAVARLDLVRTLRELGLDLPTIRRIADRELALPEVAAAHAAALAVQIRDLRLRRAILTAVAERGSDPEEMELMHKLATLSGAERRRLAGDFLDATLADPALSGIARSLTPELPDDPEPAQVAAWVELAELTQDPAFRDTLRNLADHHRADHHRASQHPTDHHRADQHPTDQHPADQHPTDQHPADQQRAGRTPAAAPRRDAAALARDHAAPALTAGVDPASPQADAVVAALATQYASGLGRPDDTALRHRLLTRLETANDPRRQRYLHLLAIVNGWPPPEDLTPALDWAIQALLAHT
ncbi:DNA-binding transcriptional MerR regulator [Nonomuraea muscovyensis]|uniref:DNA-binding transcriptional MerR regulator n=1 Tax=Nonomuraea muscovyensis TaxID=1124761 RepID=A0A7X0F2F8_9ACTN|nr:MerR family transcriptional regulator [Nonomuraea muscovyensis]MBB6350465.1 DNA-binding transcriptional MerR regulator [Nonomuraea muscovyensis]